MNKTLIPVLALAVTGVAAFWLSAAPAEKKTMPTPAVDPNVKTESIVVGGGCFWCVEAIYQTVPGIVKVESGYSGGAIANPTYKQVCEGDTGHAEVLKVVFDPAKITLAEVLDVFFRAHDATTLNRQGNDVGTQYRSVIFYANDAQKVAAESAKISAKVYFKDPIVTEIAPLKEFYKAEDYHQNYFNENPGNPYCHFVIKPKLDKFKKSQH